MVYFSPKMPFEIDNQPGLRVDLQTPLGPSLLTTVPFFGSFASLFKPLRPESMYF